MPSLSPPRFSAGLSLLLCGLLALACPPRPGDDQLVEAGDGPSASDGADGGAVDPCEALGDADGDGVCDDDDRCPMGDDRSDSDGDGVADACDPCPADAPDDSDGDGVCDRQDACPGANDQQDGDSDGIPDACAPCADGSTGEPFSGGMAGCPGRVEARNRASLCGPRFSVCSAATWVARRDGAVPEAHYWTDDPLRYDYESLSGDGYLCSVSTEGAYACPEDSPMKVCATESDALGNRCYGLNCGFRSFEPNEYFGGCDVDTDTAGSLCCPL